MSVIIDQFEVVVDAQEDKEKSSEASDSGSSKKPALKPRDMAAVITQLQNRRERVRAH